MCYTNHYILFFCLCYYVTIPTLLNSFFFFFNDTATTEIYTLSLHDALPISTGSFPPRARFCSPYSSSMLPWPGRAQGQDRKSTRLNSSHLVISYAVFCLKKKKKILHSTILHLLSECTHDTHDGA